MSEYELAASTAGMALHKINRIIHSILAEVMHNITNARHKGVACN